VCLVLCGVCIGLLGVWGGGGGGGGVRVLCVCVFMCVCLGRHAR